MASRTPDVVTDGTQFFLVDVTTRTAIASLTVHVQADQTVQTKAVRGRERLADTSAY